ncbi:helix-turn-helix domain-containing protein [Bacillus sp. CGMCC 1.16541]|uniref:helix-turn-helix domain-containing protein n=1 Tax=Bacillus sp. CGMCC 1.16541 TaxID=2185143 RepID=UPI0013A5A056|nr:helix-turn-helix domain-containing protein [Bacillus sp. CGMCC 1.16541]
MNTKDQERLKAEELLRQGTTPKEIAHILNVHISTIYNWKKRLEKKNVSFSHSSLKKPTREQIRIDTKTQTKIEPKANDYEITKLKNENETLKKKVRHLEEVIADLVIKLKSKDDNWLDEK